MGQPQDATLSIGTLELRSASAGEPCATLELPQDAPAAGAPLDLQTQAVSYTSITAINEVFILHFNRNGTDTGQPIWSENFESRYVQDAPPAGLLERHWNYTSLDRTVAFRPWTALLNQNDHRLFEWSLTKSWSISGFDGTDVGEPAYEFTTGASDTEGGARFRRPLRLTADGTQFSARDTDASHRLTLSVDPSFTHGVFDLRPARYSGPTPLSFSRVNLHARRLELAADSGQSVALSFRGYGVGGDSVGLKSAPGSKILQLVASGTSLNPASWLFNASFDQRLAVPNLALNTSADTALGDGLGVVVMNDASTVPGSNPSGGGVVYVEGGALMYRGSAGTVTMLAT